MSAASCGGGPTTSAALSPQPGLNVLPDSLLRAANVY